MNHRFRALVAVLLLIFILAVPVSAQVSPTAGKPPLFVDDAGLLEKAQGAALLSKLEEISARQQMDVAIVTVSRTDGRSTEAYTEDFYDAFGYGQGPARDGVLLLIAMEEREIHITAVGHGIRVFTDAGRAYILDSAVLPLIRQGAYAQAFNEFAEQCDDFITQANTGKPYDGNFMPKGKLTPLSSAWLLIAVLAGGLVTAGTSAVLKKQMQTVAPQSAAADYAVSGSLVITGSWDRFLTTRTTRTPRVQSSSGTGSATHTSASGEAHSGTGRKF